MENYRLQKRTSPKSLYGVTWSVFGAGLFFLVLSVLLVHTSGQQLLIKFAANRPVSLAVLVVGIIAFIAVSWFGRRMKLWMLLTFYAISLPYFAFSINLAIFAYLPGEDILPILGIMLIPGGIMILMGVVGYFELVNIRKIQTVVFFLMAAFIISFIVSLIFRNSFSNWIISPLIVLLLGFMTAVDAFMMRHELENAQYGDHKEMVKIAAWYGTRLFFNYAIMLFHIIRIIGASRR